MGGLLLATAKGLPPPNSLVDGGKTNLALAPPPVLLEEELFSWSSFDFFCFLTTIDAGDWLLLRERLSGLLGLLGLLKTPVGSREEERDDDEDISNLKPPPAPLGLLLTLGLPGLLGLLGLLGVGLLYWGNSVSLRLLGLLGLFRSCFAFSSAWYSAILSSFRLKQRMLSHIGLYHRVIREGYQIGLSNRFIIKGYWGY